jgi:hypothetical protein
MARVHRQSYATRHPYRRDGFFQSVSEVAPRSIVRDEEVCALLGVIDRAQGPGLPPPPLVFEPNELPDVTK